MRASVVVCISRIVSSSRSMSFFIDFFGYLIDCVICFGVINNLFFMFVFRSKFFINLFVTFTYVVAFAIVIFFGLFSLMF